MAIDHTQFQQWAIELAVSDNWTELMKSLKLQLFVDWTAAATVEERERLYARMAVIGDMESIVKTAASNVAVDRAKAGR